MAHLQFVAERSRTIDGLGRSLGRGHGEVLIIGAVHPKRGNGHILEIGRPVEVCIHNFSILSGLDRQSLVAIRVRQEPAAVYRDRKGEAIVHTHNRTRERASPTDAG